MIDSNEIIRLIIVDDHKLFLDGLTSLLNQSKEIKLVGTANNGNDALQLLENKEADLVITDISMPEMDGMKLAKEIRIKYPNIKILALTMHNEGNMISNMLRSGITGYILKDVGKEELLNAIKTVWSGETYFSEEVKTSLMQNRDAIKQTVPIDDELNLSGRELEILKLIALEYKQQEIADKLFISPHTVIFHRRKLLYKFDVKNSAGLIRAAMEKGFLE